ncbi:MAG: glutamate formimidoyltransferase [Candidatus Thorarchaeota archaeon]|nr:MAG: glutamate formimidoyltransferase [Candidatus Thorarchaeota archaeon]RLI61193.1 MAG: glutamate formimidoyltransferase [Candidatus Thorarchaeota archaeon]
MKIVECVPNFSEGRRKEVIDALAEAIKSVEGVRLLDVEYDYDHNRSVFTFIGEPQKVKEAALRAAELAVEKIDLTKHQGAHPRMGAVDVVPFIPLHGTTIGECIELSKQFAEEFSKKCNVPVYLYAKSATRPDRVDLPNIREGEFEGLRELIGTDPTKDPDYGPKKIHPTAGCTATGARNFLIAFNCNLNTTDVRVAKACADAVRATTGGFVYVQGIGLEIPEKGMVQVSMNLTHPKRTKIHQVLEVVRNEARRFGATVVETEIVGMIPLFAILDAFRYYVQPEKLDESMILDLYYLGGAEDPKKKSFTEMSLIEFGNQVRRARATPGGGSVAAAMGSLGAALVCMVTGLSLSGRKFAAIKEEMLSHRHACENDRGVLMGLVEEDSAAFDEVMKAFKMPEDTPEQKKEKEEVLEEATKHAAEVPLKTMRHSLNALEHARIAAEKGNINAITDAGVAAHALMAAIEGAALNVRINLGNIKDKKFVEKISSEVESIISRGNELKGEILEIVERRMRELAESS